MPPVALGLILVVRHGRVREPVCPPSPARLGLPLIVIAHYARKRGWPGSEALHPPLVCARNTRRGYARLVPGRAWV